jgi:phytoene dehydrogenase-like protein
LEKRFSELGGNIAYGATVSEIQVENDRAVGVSLAGGETHRADAVISAADGYQTIFELLSGRYLDADVQKRYSEWPLFKPVVMVNFGVKREFKEDPWMVAVKADPPIEAGFLNGNWLPVRIFNYSPAFAPEGRTVIQVMVESAWEPWHSLRENKEAYKAEKKAVEAQVLKGLTKYWPELSGQIEISDVSTPHTMWRYTLNRHGAYEGFAITDKTISARVFRTLPKLRQFYMAGQWTSPGGGVVPSLMTGRHAVMLMCRQDGKKFHRST